MEDTNPLNYLKIDNNETIKKTYPQKLTRQQLNLDKNNSYFKCKTKDEILKRRLREFFPVRRTRQSVIFIL